MEDKKNGGQTIPAVGKNSNTVRGEMVTPIARQVGKTDKKIRIMFRESRKFDLHVGRIMVTFRGRESKSVPAAWLKHPDFLQQKKYFVVKGA